MIADLTDDHVRGLLQILPRCVDDFRFRHFATLELNFRFSFLLLSDLDGVGFDQRSTFFDDFFWNAFEGFAPRKAKINVSR